MVAGFHELRRVDGSRLIIAPKRCFHRENEPKEKSAKRVFFSLADFGD
jgi:hypothetical protein